MALSVGLGAQIEALERQAKAALGLLDLVKQSLPDSVKNHVLSASYQEGQLHLTADSAVWSTHIRYGENALREKLVGHGEKPFTILKVRVGRP